MSSQSSRFSWEDSVIALEIRHSLWSLFPTESRLVSCLAVGSAIFLLQIFFTGSLGREIYKFQSLGPYPCGVTVAVSYSWGTGQHHSTWHTQSLQPKGPQLFLHPFTFTKGQLLTLSSNTCVKAGLAKANKLFLFSCKFKEWKNTEQF